MNRDFFKIHLSITLARINILTSSFFLAITLSKALHLTPILLKLERFFFSPYKGGPIFKNPFPQAVFRCTTIFFLFLGIFDIEWLIPPYGPTKFRNQWSLLMIDWSLNRLNSNFQGHSFLSFSGLLFPFLGLFRRVWKKRVFG